MRLRFEQNNPDAVEHPEETLRSLDGVVMPHGFLRDVPYRDLYQDRWVCIVSADNAEVGTELTLPQLREMPWVMLYYRPTAFAPAFQHMRLLGVEPKVDVVVDRFLPMPFLVAGTNRVALLQQTLAGKMAVWAGVRVMAPPFNVVPMTEAMWWHPMYRTDPAHAWLRDIMATAGKIIDDGWRGKPDEQSGGADA